MEKATVGTEHISVPGKTFNEYLADTYVFLYGIVQRLCIHRAVSGDYIGDYAGCHGGMLGGDTGIDEKL